MNIKHIPLNSEEIKVGSIIKSVKSGLYYLIVKSNDGKYGYIDLKEYKMSSSKESVTTLIISLLGSSEYKVYTQEQYQLIING